MPLTAAALGTKLAAPVAIVPQGRPAYLTDAKAEWSLVPTVIVRKDWANVPANVTNGISASHAGAGSAGTTSMTIGGSLASGGVATLPTGTDLTGRQLYGRNVVITVTHASSVVAMSGTITGKRLGRTVTEAWSVTATGTSKTFTGAVAFDTVSSITETVAADASANTIIAGTGKVLGLVFKAASVKVIDDAEDGAAVTDGVIVKASSSANADARGTYTPNSAPNAALDFTVWYLCDDTTVIY